MASVPATRKRLPCPQDVPAEDVAADFGEPIRQAHAQAGQRAGVPVDEYDQPLLDNNPAAPQQIIERGDAAPDQASGQPIHLIGVEFRHARHSVVGFEALTLGRMLQRSKHTAREIRGLEARKVEPRWFIGVCRAGGCSGEAVWR